MNASATNAAEKAKKIAHSLVSPNFRYSKALTTPPSASINGYRAELFFWQWRQRAPRNRKLTTGMLSYQRMTCLQFGQRERGLLIDSPRGRRRITTFRKLPMTRPRAAANANSISAVYGTPFVKHS